MSDTTQSNINWLETLTGQTLLFGVLAKLIYQYPEKAWLESLITEDLFADVPFACEQPAVVAGLKLMQQWGQENRGGLAQDALDAIRIDHTRLFLGPGKAPALPWESVYFNEESLVFQQQTLQVRGWYARFGLKLINLHKEPDDHIGLELEFLACLAKQALEALDANKTKRFDQLLNAQRSFLTEHLLRWGPLWCELVIQNAKTDFYRGVAQLVHGSLLELAAVLALPLPEPVKIKYYD